jgi:hypothetical protein
MAFKNLNQILILWLCLNDVISSGSSNLPLQEDPVIKRRTLRWWNLSKKVSGLTKLGGPQNELASARGPQSGLASTKGPQSNQT